MASLAVVNNTIISIATLQNQLTLLQQEIAHLQQHSNNESGSCQVPNHAESPGNDIILTAMIVIVTMIITITISFEYAKEEWERRMHASLKAVVQNVFSELTILGFIGLIMFLTTKLGKERLDLLAYEWFNSTCFKSNLWCEEDVKVLVCPENVLLQLVENVHIVLFLIMLLFLIEAVLVIRAGKKKMLQWRQHEEFCLCNSLGVSAARVKLTADHFENVKWWSCGCYDGVQGKWLCGCYPKKTTTTTNKNGSMDNTTNDRGKNGSGEGKEEKGFVGKSNSINPTGLESGTGQKSHSMDHEETNDKVWDALTTAKHFGKLPARRFFMCPCLHARNEYFEARSQLRYCTMRTGFINAFNQEMKNKNVKETKLSTNFDFAEYISHILGEHLAEMVDVSAFNWLALWFTFCIFMIFDFLDLWQRDQGYFLTLVAFGAAYLSCFGLMLVRHNTIKIEHALLNDAFMSFHLSHGVCSTLMCSCCFSAHRIHQAHQNAIENRMYENRHQGQLFAHDTRRLSVVEREKLRASIEATTLAAALDERRLSIEKTRKKNADKRVSFTPERKDHHDHDGLTTALLSDPKNNQMASPNNTNLRNASMKFIQAGKLIGKVKRSAKLLFTQATAPSVEVDPIKLHRFDTHKVDYNHDNHRPSYKWVYDKNNRQWLEVPVNKSELQSCLHPGGITHHESLFFFGKHHRSFLFNYVRMSLLLLAVYMGVFISQFGHSVLQHWNGEPGEDPGDSEEPQHLTHVVGPVLFFVLAIIPVVVHDMILPDIVAKIVQTTKTEQMIDIKHVHRVIGMMKAKNALMVLHNMSSFMHHIDVEATFAIDTAKQVLATMPGFSHLDSNTIAILLTNFQPKTYLKNSVVVKYGEMSTSMYIVISGTVGTNTGKLGSDEHFTNYIKAGAFFGSTAMITGEVSVHNYVSCSKVLLFELSHDAAKKHLPEKTWDALKEAADALNSVLNQGSLVRQSSIRTFGDAATERKHSNEEMDTSRHKSIGSVVSANLINRLSPSVKRKPRHRHLKSALQMCRELAMLSTFQSIDRDHGGTISNTELIHFFTQLFPKDHPHHKFHVDQVKVLGLQLDVSGDGEIDEKEFHDFMMPIIVREDTLGNPEESARRMFNILDEQGGQGCGKVTTKKFKDLLELFGMNMSYEEVNDLFHEYDEDFDGYLDEDEFVRMMIESGIES